MAESNTRPSTVTTAPYYHDIDSLRPSRQSLSLTASAQLNSFYRGGGALQRSALVGRQRTDSEPLHRTTYAQRCDTYTEYMPMDCGSRAAEDRAGNNYWNTSPEPGGADDDFGNYRVPPPPIRVSADPAGGTYRSASPIDALEESGQPAASCVRRRATPDLIALPPKRRGTYPEPDPSPPRRVRFEGCGAAENGPDRPRRPFYDRHETMEIKMCGMQRKIDYLARTVEMQTKRLRELRALTDAQPLPEDQTFCVFGPAPSAASNRRTAKVAFWRRLFGCCLKK